MAANSVAESLIGAVVIAAAVGFALHASDVGGRRAQGDVVPLVARFRSVEGVAVGTEVRLAGIQVGRVTDLALDPASYMARASLAVDAAVPIPEDSDVSIATESLLGGAFVEITPGASEFMLAAGDEILNTQSSVNLLNLLMRFGAGE